MNQMPTCRLLFDKLCDHRISESEFAELEETLRTSKTAREEYHRHMRVHGLLSWNQGIAAAATATLPLNPSEADLEAASASAGSLSVTPAFAQAAERDRRNARGRRLLAAVCVVAILAVPIAFLWLPASEHPADQPVAETEDRRADVPVTDAETVVDPDSATDVADNAPDAVRLESLDRPLVAEGALEETHLVDRVRFNDAAHTDVFHPEFSDNDVVAFINEHLAAAWKDAEVLPAAMADRATWTRRAALRLTGSIPRSEGLLSSVDPPSADDRRQTIAELLGSPAFAEHFATTWTNLMVGRSNRPGIDRDGLASFVQRSIDTNRGWDEIVGDLISAEGRSDRNGASNFLLAHLNEQATPATAVTSRLFLGTQLQCVQCHDHPFVKDWDQSEFWALNSFFKQTKKRRLEADAGTDAPWELYTDEIGGPTNFEDRRGIMMTALPAYNGEQVSPDAGTNRRAALAKLVRSGDRPQIARAMVNRTWAQLVGAGFAPVDDMGAHRPANHPELLEGLTEAFTKSGFSIRRLVSWIALSDAFALSSELTEAQGEDEPAAGDSPMFTRVYPEHMTPEQVYDSVRTALHSVAGYVDDQPETSRQHRGEWIAQFVHVYNTDENDEAESFDATITQAMTMMNEAELQDGIRESVQRMLVSRLALGAKPEELLDHVCRSVLTRNASADERQVFRDHHRFLRTTKPADAALQTALEDMLWVYLNSSEFVVVH